MGEQLKASKEAVVGSLAMRTIQEYHFTKGFFGTNGVTKKAGCTTPDANEAMVKRTAMEQCRESYVLCESSKFDNISSIKFATFSATTFLTERRIAGYENCENIVVVEE